MASFYVYETKNLVLQLLPTDSLQDVKEVIVTISQKLTGAVVEKSDTDLTLDDQTAQIMLRLSQEETAKFTPGKAMVQVNLLYNDTERDTTVQDEIKIFDNLHKEVMK